MARSVYLDYNATTPLAPEVLETINTTLRDAWGNPSSSHSAGNSQRLHEYITQADRGYIDMPSSKLTVVAHDLQVYCIASEQCHCCGHYEVIVLCSDCAGRKARHCIDEARASVARMINVAPAGNLARTKGRDCMISVRSAKPIQTDTCCSSISYHKVKLSNRGRIMQVQRSFCSYSMTLFLLLLIKHLDTFPPQISYSLLEALK